MILPNDLCLEVMASNFMSINRLWSGRRCFFPHAILRVVRNRFVASLFVAIVVGFVVGPVVGSVASVASLFTTIVVGSVGGLVSFTLF